MLEYVKFAAKSSTRTGAYGLDLDASLYALCRHHDGTLLGSRFRRLVGLHQRLDPESRPVNPISRTLILVGILCIIAGLVWRFLPLGKLPGDIAIEKENFRFYFPLGTSLLVSLVLSLILYLFRFFGGR